MQAQAVFVDDPGFQHLMLSAQEVHLHPRDGTAIHEVVEGMAHSLFAVEMQIGGAIVAMRAKGNAFVVGIADQLAKADLPAGFVGAVDHPALPDQLFLAHDDTVFLGQELEGQRGEPFFDLSGGDPGGVAVDVRSRGSGCGRSVSHSLAITGFHPDLGHGDAQHFGDDQRHFGIEFLPHFHASGADGHGAVDIGPDQRGALI